MKLNHINLPVVDVALSQQFYAKYFGMKTTLELARNTMVMMDDGEGMVLNISNFQKATEIKYPEDFHVGFYYPTTEEVDQLHAQMVADGLEAEPPKKQPGRYGFYYQVPGGAITEVACLSH